jgi:plastocyanin
MWTRWLSSSAIVTLGLCATVAASLAGCGGQPSDSSTAVVMPEPNSLTTKATSGSTAAPATSAPSSTPASTASTTPVKAEGWGTLKGQVVFGGDPPPVSILQEQGKAAKDPNVCAKDGPIKSERLVVDAAGKGVKNVLVYLPKPTAVNEDAKKAAAAAKVDFDQKGCVFEPHVMAIMAGTPITLKSSDPVNHNVNVKLKNSTFNKIVVAGDPNPFTPSLPERTPGQVICDIHPWMSSWWMVLDHPYFAVTDDKGYYEIKNVPAGTQKVVVWQEAVGFVTASSGEDVTLKANDSTVKEFTIDPAKVRPAN